MKSQWKPTPQLSGGGRARNSTSGYAEGKKCQRCLILPAIVTCDDCTAILCQNCLIREAHPITHKINPLRSILPSSELTAIHLHPDHLFAESLKLTSEESPANVRDATHACVRCRYAPLLTSDDDHVPHGSVISVQEAASAIATETQAKADALTSLGQSIFEALFEAKEADLIIAEERNVYLARLLTAQEVREFLAAVISPQRS